MLLKGIYRLTFLGGLFILLACSVFWASKLQFSFKFEEFFSVDDPDIQFYHLSKEKFSKGDDALTIGLTSNQSIFDVNFLHKIDSLEKKINLIDGIKESISIVSLTNPVRGIFGVREVPFVDLSQPSKLSEDTTNFFLYPDVHPKFVSPDRKSTCLFLILEKEVPDESITQIMDYLDEFKLHKHHLYGLNIAQEGYESSLKKEMIWLSILAFSMIILITYLCYRSYSFLIIAILFLISTVVITLGFTYWMGATLNVLTVTIPAIVAIVSMSDLIHIFSRFVEEEEGAIERKITLAYQDIGHSLQLTSFTTAIGFLGLVFTEVTPFIHFGIITSFGILVAYLLTLFLVPILIEKIAHQETFFNWSLNRTGLFDLILSHRGKILLGALVLTGSSIFFGSKVELNTYIFDDLDAKDPLSKNLAFFENNFFGIRDLELYITIQEPYNAFDEEVVRQLENLENYLSESYQARSVYSLATQVKRLNRMYYGGIPSKYEIPERSALLGRVLDYLEKERDNPLVRSLVSETSDFTRIQVKSNDWGSAITKVKNDQLRSYLNANIDSEVMTVKLSGEPLFLDEGNEKITKHLFISLLGALIIVILIVGFIYRSFSMSLIAIIPNVLPLIAMFLLMYWLDISLKKSTAVVFTIAFGIAVDDTIHFLSRLKTELSRKVPLNLALNKTFHSTGKAILITSFLLIGGFGSFAFSTFQSTFLTGTMVSIALVSALIADLILLPCLIMMFYKEK